MKKLTLAMMVAMAFVSFGCKKKGGSDSSNAMAKMSEFADEMCKCKDAKCAQEVSDKMTKWGQEQSKNQKEPPKMNEADTAKAQEIGKRMGDCMTKAMGAGTTPTGDTTGSAAPTGDMAGSAAGSAAMAGSGDMAGSAAAGSAAGSAAPAAGSAAGSAAP